MLAPALINTNRKMPLTFINQPGLSVTRLMKIPMNNNIPAITRLINPTKAIVPSVAPRFCPIIDDGEFAGIRFVVKFNLAKGNLSFSASSINQTASSITPANTILRAAAMIVRLLFIFMFLSLIIAILIPCQIQLIDILNTFVYSNG